MKRILTCINHQELRWNCKEVAWSENGYNGSRHLFFHGKITVPVQYYADMSGVDTDYALECTCDSTALILAPEDRIINPWAYPPGM